MTKFLFCFFLSLSSFFFASEEELPDVGVTYTLSGGRFGDNLLSLLHAKWISYKYHLPLLYQPFPYSSELVLDREKIHFDISQKNHFDKSIRLGRKQYVKAHWKGSLLYISPYFPEAKYEIAHTRPCIEDRKHGWPYFRVDWHDPEFRKEALRVITLQKPVQTVRVPSDRITIALHIREGGGFDDPRSVALSFPWKAPPFHFYVDGLKKVLGLLPQKKIYCYLFTDAKDPASLVKKIQQEMPSDAPIEFDFRKTGNRHDANVLEDFFSLFLFDILIRPDSNFSLVPSLLHDYAILVTPGHFTTTSKNTIEVDEFSIVLDHKLYRNLLLSKQSEAN